MNMDRLRHELSIRAKNGISFLLSGTLLWIVFGILYLQSFDLQTKNIMMLLMTGLLFPLAVGISIWMKVDWKQEGHPLQKLGMVLNVAQFIYFPIVFWAFLEDPENMIIFFAVITGAHFFPYGWFYQATGYYVMAPVISVSMIIIGWIVEPSQLWIIPMLMSLLLIILILWLWIDYKKKSA